MKYDDAIKLIKKNQHRIGTQNDRGFTISDIIIVPSNLNEQKLFMQDYIMHGNWQCAINPFTNSDVKVWAIDKDYLFKSNLVFYDEIGE